MNWSVSKDGQILKLQVENNRDSAMAFQRGRLKREGGTLSISARKVLVSALVSDGAFQTTIDLDGVTEIYLGGLKIWTDNDSGSKNLRHSCNEWAMKMP